MTLTLTDGRHFSKWIGVKPLFTSDLNLAKNYTYAIQAQSDCDKLLQQGYKAYVKRNEPPCPTTPSHRSHTVTA
ncbi:MAG TPA: hypothetical protein PL173_13020 [Saprospiraceae bacterium]|nr:hypothetical protein [Saprospiraceae bacterium]HNI55784.1 hypothetical protein [Chitinophagales bacterium]